MKNEQIFNNELSELFNSPENIRSDLSEAYDFMIKHMHNKYMGKINKVIKQCEQNAVLNPCPEINLIKAIKPFAPLEAHQKLDSIMDMFVKFSALQELNNSRDITAAQKSEDASVHDDGVYEVDERCMATTRAGESRFNGFAGMLMVMSALNRNK